MSLGLAMAIWACAWIAVSAIARTASGARLSLLLALALLPLPWALTTRDAQRVVVAFALLLLFISAVDFAAGRRPPTFGGRLRYAIAFTAFIDAATAAHVRRHFDLHATWRVIVALGAAALAAASWIAVSDLSAALRLPVRLAAAATCVLVFAELNSDAVRIASAACGVHFAPVHAAPHLSRTIIEFWSRRWNLLGARWFRQHTFMPLRARSSTLALFTLFGVSALLHVYLIASAVPPKWMLMCAAFFLAQPPLIIAERRLRVRRWPPYAARLWTFTLLAALLPLLLMPLLAALGLDL